MELETENKLGITEDSVVQDAVEMNFDGEVKEAGLYSAMARQAQREGYPEMAEVFKRIAIEEVEHAARFAELNGMISSSTKENIEKMLEGEKMSNKAKKQAADKAREEGLEAAADYFNESAKDEGRHARMLEGLLERYF